MQCKTPEEALDIIGKNDAVLVDLSTTWCEPCKILEEEIEKIRKKHANVKVVKLNKEEMRKNEKNWLEKIPFLTEAYNLSGVPVLLFIKNGKVIDEYLDKDRDGLGLYWGLVYEDTIEKTLKHYGMV